MERFTVRVKEGDRKGECFIPGNKDAIEKVEYINENGRWKSEEYKGKAIDKLTEYEDLEEQGKLLELPCAVGDFALFSNGDILPITHITLSNPKDGISVGCQNGIHISMNLNYGSWCKGFFKSREEAEATLKELPGATE